MDTLLLDSNWDLTLDSAGNIALATGSYAIAQDVASYCRTFLGEVWYNFGQGIPYFEQILGFRPSLQFLRSQYITNALQVPGVKSIKVFFTGLGPSRELGGQIQITDQNNIVSVINTSNLQGVAPWYVNAAVGGAYSE